MPPLTKEQSMHLRSVDEINWDTWTAVDIATLLFVFRQRDVLLIRKRRGLGAGKINAPGGRVEEGETIEQAAVREVVEEVGVTPLEPVYKGENRFQFTDGYSLHIHIFTSASFVGEPITTEEAIPLWYPVSAFPFDEMWVDDALWIPLMMRGERFSGRFIFQRETMLSYSLSPA